MKIKRKFNSDHLDQTSIERIRNRFLDEFKVNKNYYDEYEARLVALDDYYIGRFLHSNNCNEDAAYHNLIDTLKWIHCNGLRQLSRNANYFPEEFHKTGAFFHYSSDRDGNLSIHFRIKYLRRIKELRSTMEYYAAHMFYTIDRKASGSGYVFVVDFEDARLQNTDFEMFKYIIYILKTHFPCGVAYILIVDLPWILRTFWSMVGSWIPSDKRDLIKMATRKDIHLFIDKNNLPDYLGGQCALPYKGDKVVPKNCPTLFDFTSKKLKLNDQTCCRIMSIYEPILEELRQRC